MRSCVRPVQAIRNRLRKELSLEQDILRAFERREKERCATKRHVGGHVVGVNLSKIGPLMEMFSERQEGGQLKADTMEPIEEGDHRQPGAVIEIALRKAPQLETVRRCAKTLQPLGCGKVRYQILIRYEVMEIRIQSVRLICLLIYFMTID